MRAGLYKDAEEFIEFCSEFDEYRDYNWINTSRLIWDAEKIGRFDLAKTIKLTVEQNNTEIKSEPSFNINSGHILLMEGSLYDAFDYYNRAIDIIVNASQNKEGAQKFVIEILKNDMDILRWLEVGNISFIDEVYQNYKIKKRDFKTSKADSLCTQEFVNTVVGTWAMQDSSIVMCYYSNTPLCQYKFYAKNASGELDEVFRSMSNIRCTKRDGHMYLEEFNPEKENGAIITGEVIEYDDRTLSIKIIDNGNHDDIGVIREYHRIE